MTIIAASAYRVPRERPSLAAKLCEAYLLAAVFALEAWADSARLASARGDGPQAARDQATAMRDFWEAESERCEAIVCALEKMGP